jgi:hypothetical protein
MADNLARKIVSLPGSPSGKLEPIPDTKPPIVDLRVASDGRIWVKTSQPSERFSPTPRLNAMTGQRVLDFGWREPTVFDVFEPDGTFVGSVSVPYGFRLLKMRGDLVWGVRINEDGVEFAQKWRIDWKS